MSSHLLFRNCRLFALTIAGMFLITVGFGNFALGATIPFVEDFSGTAPDFSFSVTDASIVPTVTGGVLNIDAAANASGRAVNALVDFGSSVNTLIGNGQAIRMDLDFTPTVINGGNSSPGFLAFSNNPASGGFPGGANSGYLADVVFQSGSTQGFLRIYDSASLTILNSALIALNSTAVNETYHLTFTATPALGGFLDLSLTMTDTAGTLIDNDDGIMTITATTPAIASTGQYFGIRHRVGSNGATSSTRTFDAVYDNFSIIPEPSTYLLGGLGLFGLALVRKRQRK